MKRSLLLVFSMTLMLFFSANVIAQTGNRAKVANNNELIMALDDPSVTSIEITQDGYYEAIFSNASTGTVITKDGNGDRSCTLSITTTNTCFVDDTTLNPASAATSGDPSCPPQPTSGADNGWSSPDAEIHFQFTVDQYEYSTNFTADIAGEYTLQYRWDAFNYAVKTVFLFSTPEIVQLSADDTVCGLQTDITYEINLGTTPTAGDTVIWTVNGDTTAGSGFPTVIGAADTFTFDTTDCGAYQIILYVANDLGCGYDRDTLNIYFYDTPVVIANTPDSVEVCGLTTFFSPSFNVDCDAGVTPTGVWTAVPNTGVSFSGDTVTVTDCGNYDFIYTVTNGLCVEDDTVNVYFYDTPVVSAGPNDTVCGLTATLAPTATVTCDNGGTLGTTWAKVSGPGTVNFDADTVTVSACGAYVFRYTAVNGLCTDSADVEIYFTDTPTIINTYYPDTVCGFDTDEFYVYYSVDCSAGGDTAVWTTNSTHATITNGVSTDSWIASTDTCGTFEYYYTATNGLCSTVDTFQITFFETPDPTIVGEDTVYTCSTVSYDVIDNTCNDFNAYTFTWTITEGLFNGVTTTTVGNPVSATFGKNTYTSEITVHAELSGTGQVCDGYDTVTIQKQLPTLEGQVKYWNEFETYMPSPFATDDYYTVPFDYFYVILLRDGTPVDTAYVQPRLMEDLNELMSYFDFTLYTYYAQDCDIEYTLQIWDGSFLYQDALVPDENKTIGNSYTYNSWGGVNATDALAIQLMVGGANDINGTPWNYTWVNVNTDVPQYGYYSHSIADVNSTNFVTNGGITALDALTAKYRAVGLLGSYPNNDGGSNNQFNPNFRVTGRMVDSLPQMTWTAPFDYDNVNDIPFVHSGTDYMYFSNAIDHKYTSDSLTWGGKKNYINLYYEAIGDVNASYVPPGSGLKAEASMGLTYEGLLSTNVGSEITIPVSIDRDVEAGAITLSFAYRNDLIEVLGTNYNDDDMFINQEEGILNIAWFNTEALVLDADATIAQIRVRILKDIPEGTKLFSLNAMSEIADANANPIGDINLKSKGVSTSGIVNLTDLTSSVYPNPSNDVATITYTLPEAGTVKVEVYNNTGVLVQTLVDMTQEAGLQNATFNTNDVQAGVYIYHITVQGETQTFSAVKRLIVVH